MCALQNSRIRNNTPSRTLLQDRIFLKHNQKNYWASEILRWLVRFQSFGHLWTRCEAFTIDSHCFSGLSEKFSDHVKNQDKLSAIRWLMSRLITDRWWWSMSWFKYLQLAQIKFSVSHNIAALMTIDINSLLCGCWFKAKLVQPTCCSPLGYGWWNLGVMQLDLQQEHRNHPGAKVACCHVWTTLDWWI